MLTAPWHWATPIWYRWQVLHCHKVHIFWKGQKILQNLHQLFVLCTASQVIDGDFAKFCGLLKLYELYQDMLHYTNWMISSKKKYILLLDFFQVHAYIMASIEKEMPNMFGKDKAKKRIIKTLDVIFGQIEREHKVSHGDFPEIKVRIFWEGHASLKWKIPIRFDIVMSNKFWRFFWFCDLLRIYEL